MIVVDDKEWLLIVTQPDHARFAAELLSLWRVDNLPEHPRREELLFAVREHDNGWQEADSAPRIDPVRLRPYDFTGYPPAGRREIWLRGILRHAALHPLAALLIADHAAMIHRPLDGEWQRLLDSIEDLRQQWSRDANFDRRDLDDDYKWLRLADALSLAFCTRDLEAASGLGMEVMVDSEYLRLEPFPLAGTTTFRIPARRVPNRPYDRDSILGGELARARWSDLTVRVAPL